VRVEQRLALRGQLAEAVGDLLQQAVDGSLLSAVARRLYSDSRACTSPQ
jgi:hypothetical protein